MASCKWEKSDTNKLGLTPPGTPGETVEFCDLPDGSFIIVGPDDEGGYAFTLHDNEGDVISVETGYPDIEKAKSGSKQIQASSNSTYEYVLGLSNDEEDLGDSANDESIAMDEMKDAVKSILKKDAQKIKMKYKEYLGIEEQNCWHNFELSGPSNLIDKLKKNLE